MEEIRRAIVSWSEWWGDFQDSVCSTQSLLRASNEEQALLDSPGRGISTDPKAIFME